MRLSIDEFLHRFPDHAVAKELLGTSNHSPKIDPIKKKNQAAISVNSTSALETVFAQQLHLAGMPLPQREYHFHPKRKWRMDFAWPDMMVAAEVEGGVWNYGRHNRPQGFIADTEKYNTAASMGWTILRFTGAQIRSGEALNLVENVFVLKSETENSTKVKIRENL